MRRLLIPLAAFGCAPPREPVAARAGDAPIEVGDARPPPPLDLDLGYDTRPTGGERTTFLVGGARPGELVVLGGSLAGAARGAGPCPGPLGGLCLDLVPPVRELGRAQADADGLARFPVDVPPGAGGRVVAVQAGAPRGDDAVISSALELAIAAPGACDPDPSLSVVRVVSRPGPIEAQRELQVDLDAPAEVAALCVSASDPTGDRHLVESHGPATSHVLHLEGLVTPETYTCRVAPTCPTMLDPAPAVTFTLGPPPADVPVLVPSYDPALGMTGAWTLLNHAACSPDRPHYLIAYDERGRPRWWSDAVDAPGIDVNAHVHPQYHAVVWGGGTTSAGRPTVVDLWKGQVYKANPPGFETRSYHHDGQLMPDDRFLLLEQSSNTDGTDVWIGFRVSVFDPMALRVDVEVDSQAFVDAGTLPLPRNGNNDPYHANWMEWVEEPGGPILYLSLCFDRSIVAVDPTTSQISWRFARNEGWTLLDEQGSPLTEAALPQCQHGLEVDGDRFLLYDNGQQRGYTQGVEWRIDGTRKVAQRLWTWTEPGFMTPFLGDIDDLGSGRVLITRASLGCAYPGAAIIEVDQASGAVAHRLEFPTDDNSVYRSERYDGCDLFASARHCPIVAERWAAIEPLFGP